LYKLHCGGRHLGDPEIIFDDLALMHNVDVVPE
jgi:hypothetical protein